MSFWTAMVLIAAIWGFVTIWSRRHDRELGVTRDEDGNPVFAPQRETDASPTDAEVAELKERIAVLERIATDNNSGDARERARIAAALVRIDEEEYGFCTDCGDDIAKARLDHDPALPLCLSCARG